MFQLKNIVPVFAKDGTKLMPTSPYRARKLLEKKKAKVYKRKPFSIMLTHDSEKNTQPVEVCQDTGDKHIGVSVKTEKKEFFRAQFDNLKNEKQRHDDCRMNRRNRRSRKRYRKPRFNNRKVEKGWIAPSLDNKLNNHLNIIKTIYDVFPITTIHAEVGSFDTQKLEAIEKGLPLPEGTDYQKGERYGFETLRQAVFYRDDYKCQLCGKGIDEKAILRNHHIGFWKDDKSNRMNNLLTVCTKCHTTKNHKENGRLYGLQPKLKTFKSAAFMNTIRWMLVDRLKEVYPNTEIKTTYGVDTNLKRKSLNLEKSHTNDAYSMGRFHPNNLACELLFEKRRRNNRILQKFYDARIYDLRDGEIRGGKELGCNRTNRSEPRISDKNERIYRGAKKKKGRVTIRRYRYTHQPGDIVLFNGHKYRVSGCTHYGEYVSLKRHEKDVSTKKIKTYSKGGGWVLLTA